MTDSNTVTTNTKIKDKQSEREETTKEKRKLRVVGNERQTCANAKGRGTCNNNVDVADAFQSGVLGAGGGGRSIIGLSID